MWGPMASYLQSLPYSVHAGIFFGWLGCMLVAWPLSSALATRGPSRGRIAGETIRVVILSVASVPWVVVGVLFLALVWPAAMTGNAAVSGKQAATVPITGASAAYLWWLFLRSRRQTADR